MEILPCEAFEGVFICGKHIDFLPHRVYLLLILFNLEPFPTEFHPGTDPTDHVVLPDEAYPDDEDGCSEGGEPHKSAVLTVPYVLEFSQSEEYMTSIAQK